MTQKRVPSATDAGCGVRRCRNVISLATLRHVAGTHPSSTSHAWFSDSDLTVDGAEAAQQVQQPPKAVWCRVERLDTQQRALTVERGDDVHVEVGCRHLQ